ncbi:unnamed protein product [Psylliodes chrysocephalus]|uniref:Uncharacterized protein n=1 Tax=Psylliodes chrysocephalus TaxID=3402493 RepID=A0A9P0CYT6_9CUCU|nr:unnamed protein product [Psylliodes chrysocephala]
MLHSTLLKKLNVNYILYSHVAAKTVRQSLKQELLKSARGRDVTSIKLFNFKDGVKGEELFPLEVTPQEEDKKVLQKASN